MRAFFIECYSYRFKYFDDYIWCFLHLTGDETLKIGFDRFELDDISELHKKDKHLDMNEFDEYKLYKNDAESIY